MRFTLHPNNTVDCFLTSFLIDGSVGVYDFVVEAGRKWPKYMTGGKPQKHFITAINTAVLGF